MSTLELAEGHYPPAGFDHYYRRACWNFDDSNELLVQGHDRRSYAAASAHFSYVYGRHCASDRSRITITKRWVRFVTHCGCATEEHAEHEAEADPKFGPDCDCAYVGLPPCRDDYAWITEYVEDDAAGALPVLIVE